MTAFLLRRSLQALLVLLVMSALVYGLIGLMPGDPIDLMLTADPNVSSTDVARLKALYGLDRPLTERWLRWLARALAGDLGFSRSYAAPVLEVLGPALKNTLVLLIVAYTATFGLALPLSLWIAMKPGSWRDRIVNLGAFAGISIPVFWLALLLVILFSVSLGLLPASGTGARGPDWMDRDWRYLALPVTTLVLANVGAHIRYLRGALLDVLGQDHIRTARAKGAGRLQVMVGHALRNAMVPVITILALDLGSLFSGALVTETVFAWPGMGKLIYDAIMGSDFNLALAGLVLATAVTLLGNLLADLGYVWLDPRIGLAARTQPRGGR